MKRAILTAMIMIATALPVRGQIANLCAVPSDVDFKIDLATGRSEGPTVYKPKDEVRILLFNRNPLRDYDVEIKAVALPEPALDLVGAIFKGVAGIIKDDPAAKNKVAKPGTPTVTPTPGVPVPPRDAVLSCDQQVIDAADKSDIENKKQDVVVALGHLRASFSSYEGKVKKAAEDSKKRESALYAKAACSVLVNSFKDYRKALNWAAVKVARADVDAKASALGDGNNPGLIKKLKAAQGKFEGERTLACKAEFDEALKPVAAALKLAAELQGDVDEGLKEHKSTQEELKTNNDKMTEILGDPSRFHTTRVVGRYLDPTEVTITTKSKKSGDKTFPTTPDATVVLHFGGRPRFAISVGAAFSSLEGPEYDDITSFELDASGNRVLDRMGEPKLGRVLGLVDDSDNRVAPLLMLHTRFAESKGVFSAYHLALGLTARVGTDSSAVEYLVGFSASLAEERFFITVGGYYGRVEQVTDGFFVGAPLPTEITDLPVRKDREWAPAVSLSWKIK